MSVSYLPSARRSHRGGDALSIAQKVQAVFRHPALYELGELIPARSPVGRPAKHPGYLLLGYGVLARLYRSAIAVQTEIKQPAMWELICATVAEMAAELPGGLDQLPGRYAPEWDAYRYARNRHLTDPDVLTQLQARFTECAVDQARGLGLLRPDGGGSWTHPHRSRIVYGDGTVVRPLYRPLKPDENRTLDANGGKQRRQDRDAADYHRHDGTIHGQNYVALYARGDGPQQRVVLAADRVERPGREADTAVDLVHRLHAVAGDGIQAIVYDGAMRGTHIDQIMTTTGLLVINKVHASGKTAARRGATAAARWHALGTWEHGTGTGACHHTLAAVDGAVCEVDLDDTGRPVVLSRLERRQVKRSRRSSGAFHFNVAYDVPCPSGPFLAWVTPHGETGDRDHRRADAVRVIAEGEPDFDRLYGLRNDAESFNSQYKRTLLVDRAMSLGGRRQLLDVLSYGLLHNALTQTHQARVATTAHRRRAA